MYLALAKESKWIAFSLPLHNVLKENFLHLLHNQTQNILSIENYCGLNNSFLLNLLSERRKMMMDAHEQLLDVLKNWTVVEHEEFKNKFYDIATEVQEGIVNLFKGAKDSNMLVPCRPDGKRIKKCDVAQNRSVYELRTQNFDGLRIYFDQQGESLFLLDFGFKSNYPTTNAQTKALKKAAAKSIGLKARFSIK